MARIEILQAELIEEANKAVHLYIKKRAKALGIEKIGCMVNGNFIWTMFSFWQKGRHNNPHINPKTKIVVAGE